MTDNMRGALLMMASTMMFTTNDAFLKSLNGALPVFQTLTVRTAMVVLALGIWVSLTTGWQIKEISRRDFWLIILRAIVEAGAAFFIVVAIFNMKLANMTAILQMLPLAVPLAARFMFNDPLSKERLIAIGIGFVGMLCIVQPGGDGFNTFSLYAMAGVICVTGRDIIARMLRRELASTLLSFYAALGVFLCSGVAMLSFEAWTPIPAVSWIGLVGSAASILLGYVLSVQVMRQGDISFTAQFRYFGLLVSLMYGYFIFSEWPNGVALIGAGLIVIMGLYSMSTETRRR